jgi:hypothetical protein
VPLESTQPLKNEYQDTPGGKDGRCVRVTTFVVPKVEKIQEP